MAASSNRPCLLVADEHGNIYENDKLLMLCRRGAELALPKPDELMPLPDESELFLLPGRRAIGLDEESGEIEETDDLAVAAFAAPAHTLSAHPAYVTMPGAPMLPLFAYGAVGFSNGRMYVCAKRVDAEPRQVFIGFSAKKIRKAALEIATLYPKNRLIQHITHKCALTYGCPAAKNFCIGRYEAPLPVSRTCTARCIGCISEQDDNSEICATPQTRMDFTPTPKEIVEVMQHHAKNVAKSIYSFGQGCEGDPLTEAKLITEAVTLFRSEGGIGTVNMNTNASLPKGVESVCRAGLTSIRVSLNSAREESYNRYYRPVNYSLADVRQSIITARSLGVFVSLNLLFFPGFTDTEEETLAIIRLWEETRFNFIQLRNLNIDPEYYLRLMSGVETGPCMGLTNFRKRIRKACPGVDFGYFNPFVEPGFNERTCGETVEPE